MSTSADVQPDPLNLRPPAADSFRLEFKHVAVILLLGSTAIALWRAFPLSSKDLWTHLKYGEWICNQRSLPDNEPFCASATEAQPVTHTQWLTQAAFYQIYRFGAWIAGGSEMNRLAGGVEMLRLALALLILTRMILLLIAFRLCTGSLLYAVIALAVSMVLTWTNLFELRPHVVGEVFFAALMVLLSQPTPTRAQTIAAVPFLVLWANCHASFLGGFGFIGLCLAARILDRARLGLTFRDFLCRDLRTRRLAEIWVLGFVAVGFLNPHGWTLFDKILTVDGHYNMIFLEEWQPLRMERGFGWHGIFLASMLAVVGTHLLSPSGFSNGDMLLLFAFACAGCMQQHMLVWWAMVLPWVLAPHWTAIIGANKSTSESNPVRVGMGAKIAMGVALGAFVAASPIVAWFASGRPVPPSQSLDAATPWALGIQLQTEPNPEPTAFPELHRILAENYPGGRFRGTIVATPKRADFLVWAGLRTTFCSQLYLFTSKYWTDQELLLQCHPGWWETFDMLEVNMIVLGPDEYPELRRHILADAGWQTLQRPGPLLDPQFGSFDSWIFARKKPVVE